MDLHDVPAFCPTCRRTYPSGLKLHVGSALRVEGLTTECPRGHEAFILDGTYRAIDKLSQFLRDKNNEAIAKQILKIAQSVADRKTSSTTAIDEVGELLPNELGAAIKQLGSKNPLIVLLVILGVLTAVSTLTVNVTNIYKSLFPDPPSSPTVIFNDNRTFINPAASGNGRNNTVSNRLNRHERRRAESLKRKEDKPVGRRDREAKQKE